MNGNMHATCPSLQMLWLQSSLASEMKGLSFAHITHFQHRHFKEASHDFQLHHPVLFLNSLADDMGAEADSAASAMQYRAQHRHSADLGQCWVTDLLSHQLDSVRQALVPQRRPGRKSMPKHFYINAQYRSSSDQGTLALCLEDWQVHGHGS